MSKGSRPARQPERSRYVSVELGRKAQSDAERHHNGDLTHVAQLCGTGVVEAILETYPEETHPSVIVLCGPGFNGLVGLSTALALAEEGYAVSLYQRTDSMGPLATRLVKKAEEQRIQVCEFVGSTLDFYNDLVIDAVFGLHFDGQDVRPEYLPAIEYLGSTGLPLVSIDYPSGWDVQKGPREIDVRRDTFVKPDTLVSLGVPKDGAKYFSGSFHFIAGRHLPPTWGEENAVELIPYPENEKSCVLFASNAMPFQGTTGEIYGKPGQFQATLFSKEGRRFWVSDSELEDNPELWDELD